MNWVNISRVELQGILGAGWGLGSWRGKSKGTHASFTHIPFLFLISQQILNTAARTLKCCNKEILLKLAYSCSPSPPSLPFVLFFLHSFCSAGWNSEPAGNKGVSADK